MQIDFFTALFLTILIETGAYWLFLRGKSSAGKIVLAGVLINALSLPFVWFVFPSLISDYWSSLALSELFVLLSEAFALSRVFSLKAKDAFLVSLCANAASFLLGLVLAFSA